MLLGENNIRISSLGELRQNYEIEATVLASPESYAHVFIAAHRSSAL